MFSIRLYLGDFFSLESHAIRNFIFRDGERITNVCMSLGWWFWDGVCKATFEVVLVKSLCSPLLVRRFGFGFWFLIIEGRDFTSWSSVIEGLDFVSWSSMIEVLDVVLLWDLSSHHITSFAVEPDMTNHFVPATTHRIITKSQ